MVCVCVHTHILLQQVLKKSDILYFFTKKKISKKNFCSKKIKKSKLTNFRFQLDRKLGFRVRAKNCKIEKAGRTLPTGMLLPAYQGALPFSFPALEASRSLCLMSHQRWVIRNDSSLMTHPWWLIRRRLLEASKAGQARPAQARSSTGLVLAWTGKGKGKGGRATSLHPPL